MSRKIPTSLLRQILMRILQGVSDRATVKDLQSMNIKVSRSVAARCRKKAHGAALTKDQLSVFTDKQLTDLIYDGENRSDFKHHAIRETILEQVDYFIEQEKMTGVNLYLLWMELNEQVPIESRCSYSTFWRTVSPHIKKADLSYHMDRAAPGSLMMIDFAGKMLYYTDKETGKRVGCVVFVAILANSRYSLVEILPNAQIGYVLQGLTNFLRSLNGAPLAVLMDNMGQMVRKPDRYEPKFTDAALLWANHYGVTLDATRTRAPRDKAICERLVRITYERVHAPLRHSTFYSIEELKQAVAIKVREHNEHKLSGKSYSRLDAFKADEANELSPLPKNDFELQKVSRAKVQRTYHVYLGENQNYYSVPYKLVGKYVDIKYTVDRVDIYDGLELVATHSRSYIKNGYTTDETHMTEAHKAYKESQGYKTEDFLEKADKFGPFTRKQVAYLIAKRQYPQHAFKGCLGLLSLGLLRKYGAQRLENACELGCELEQYGMSHISRILENKEDIAYVAQKDANKNSKKGKKKKDDDDDESEQDYLRGPEAFV